jgi:hypothetical protein
MANIKIQKEVRFFRWRLRRVMPMGSGLVLRPSLGQATIEFTFAMVIAVLLLLGMIQVLVWSGQDLADRRQAHETYLTTDRRGIEQTNPTFYYSSPISATVASNLYGDAFQ